MTDTSVQPKNGFKIALYLVLTVLQTYALVGHIHSEHDQWLVLHTLGASCLLFALLELLIPKHWFKRQGTQPSA